MQYNSVFDLIGPVMIGPSSSHTAGAVRIGQIIRKIFAEKPRIIDIHFYGSFAETYRGHATDVALVGGLLGFETDDPRIRDSLSHARDRALVINFFSEEETPVHPNTVKVYLESENKKLTATGISIGGGAVRITELDGFELKLSGESTSIIILHKDAYGAVASVTGMLAKNCINISHMEVSRTAKGKNALMLIETDQKVTEELVNELMAADHVVQVAVLEV